MYRECALKCTYADGCRDTVLAFADCNIRQDGAEIVMKDDQYGLEVTLVYRLFDKSDIIERFAVIKNASDKNIILEKAASAEINLPGDRAYTILNANGSWGGEFRKTQQKLESGAISFESRKGTTAHHHLPALIAAEKPDEDNGAVYFAVLAWDGNFKVSAARDFNGETSAVIGLNDFDFSKTLESGEEFKTPSVYCGIANGLGDMSRMMHAFAVKNVLPKRFAYEDLPVLYNSWEATGFNVNEAGQLKLAKIAAEIGCELFVMDDGWFSSRMSDRSGLGDWDVSKLKFPRGLKPLIGGVNALGMDFGIWVEPEMVNPLSELYRKHPDWTYHYETRKPNLMRNQLVLNMTKPEVQKYILDFLDKLLSENNIKYIKWDMNRPFSEIGTDNLKNGKELWYRHSRAVFDIVDELKKKHTDVQFEACASGGGRTDLGSLSHFDMVWPSDNTDPVERIFIQWGFSQFFPSKAMCAHVTSWNRNTSIKFRTDVASMCKLGFDIGLKELSQDELKYCQDAVANWKKFQPAIMEGTQYRLVSPYDSDHTSTIYVSKNKTRAVLFAFDLFPRYAEKIQPVRLQGLETNHMYRVKEINMMPGVHSSLNENEQLFSGEYLMNVGIQMFTGKKMNSRVIEIVAE